MESWPGKNTDSIRLDQIGDVAEPFTKLQVEGLLTPIAISISAKRLPELALLGPILGALRRGVHPRRGEVAARTIGPLTRALVSLLVLDARQLSSVQEMRESLRDLSLPCLDALEDLLAQYRAARPLIEAERMYKRDLLEHDWSISTPPGTSDRIEARVLCKIRHLAEA